MANSVVAVVVTYNRKELLLECLTALKNQPNDNLAILVVDNASTDGTRQFIANLVDNKKIFYTNTGANLGGAGGFNFGMKKAVEMGCHYVWIMDDDCIVQNDSLTELLNFANSVNDDFGFLSSYVKWKDGSTCVMNVQRTDVKNKLTDFDRVQEIKLASFVSLFIKSSTLSEMGLPIKDFFIWGDDWEFTYRVSKKHKSYFVPASVVLHKSNSNMGVDISKDESSRIDRYFYAYRNEKYFYKKTGFKGKLYHFLKMCLHFNRILFSKCKNKREKLKIMFKGLKAGKKFNPPIEYVYTKQNPLKVLEFFAEPLKYGGQEAFMLNMYKNFSKQNIKYTFCTPFDCTNDALMSLSSQRGDEIIHYNNPFNDAKRKKYILDCAKKVLTENHFDVIHIHSGSIFALLNVAKIAKKAGVKKIIVHSHCTGTKNLKYRVIKFLSDLKIRKYADVFLACSDVAAEWKFPKRIIKNKNYTVIKNGIDTNKFTFNPSVRENYRKQLNLGSALTLCNVGRFSEQKNHEFIVKIAKALKEKGQNFKFILVGEGELKNKIVEEIKALNLAENFILLEKRSDVAEIMMASDILVFPSLFEGLGIVTIEAQATGLLTLCSTAVPNEAYLTDLTHKLTLNSIDVWVEKILEFKQIVDREKYAKIIANAGFNAQQSATILEKIYYTCK